MLGQSPRISIDLDPGSIIPTGTSERNSIVEKVLIFHELQSETEVLNCIGQLLGPQG